MVYILDNSPQSYEPTHGQLCLIYDTAVVTPYQSNYNLGAPSIDI